MKRQPYIKINLYQETQAFKVYVEYYNEKGELIKDTDTRYIVEHIYEIILPILQENPNHDIRAFMNRKALDFIELEQSYYDYMGE
jgi:hypothetical protein